MSGPLSSVDRARAVLLSHLGTKLEPLAMAYLDEIKRRHAEIAGVLLLERKTR